MLVTLGSNATIAPTATQTFQYACTSAQSVYVNCTDAGDALNGHLTIQIGNDVICNDISFRALSLISYLQGGGKHNTSNTAFRVDLGSHVLEPLENLYVTIRNSHASNSMVATDVSAIVNEGGTYAPVKLTNYADKTFTDTNTLCIYAWSDSLLADDASSFTIRNQAYSATPEVQSGVNVSKCSVQNDGGDAYLIGTMAKNQVPLDTSVNYSSTIVDGVVCISAMQKQPTKAQSSKKSGQAVLRAMTSSERKAL